MVAWQRTLILGTNLTDLTSVDQAMLENRAVIAVDQDGIAARRVIDSASEQVFAKRQPNGIWYIGVFNTGTSARRTFQVSLAQLGLSHEVRVTDLWTGRSLGIVSGSYTATIAPGGVSLISARPIPAPVRSSTVVHHESRAGPGHQLGGQFLAPRVKPFPAERGWT